MSFVGTFIDDFLNATMSKNTLDIEANVSCSLEELYHGCSKEFSYIRPVWTRNHAFTMMEKIVITIPPGTKNDSNMRYVGFGEKRNNRSGDLIVRVREIPSKDIYRSGDDIVVCKKISLREALLGGKFQISLFGKSNMIDCENDVITPETEKVYDSVLIHIV